MKFDRESFYFLTHEAMKDEQIFKKKKKREKMQNIYGMCPLP